MVGGETRLRQTHSGVRDGGGIDPGARGSYSETMGLMCRLFRLAVMLGALCLGAWPAAARGDAHMAATARVFARVRNDPARLHAFIEAMPKGADLHNHLDGSIPAEDYLAHAVAAGLCIDARLHAILRPPCTRQDPRAEEALARDAGLRNAMIDALSMRGFVAVPGGQTGHDHFFATFAKFHEAASDDPGALVATEASRAAAEHIAYLEIMWTPHVRDAIGLAATMRWHGDDFAADLAALGGGLRGLVARARAETDAAEARKNALLGCGTPRAQPGCGVVIRFQTYSLRTFPPAAVFAQMALDFALVAADSRYVGVNIVAPEDDPVAVRDYTLHMRALRFFHLAYPAIKLSLHAGELAPGLVAADALRFHIRQAVEIAGASRIGHGTDVLGEDDAPGLLAELARRHVAVEINLTSNEQILGVHGTAHPFGRYRQAGVPVVICTDDEGVERTSLTDEYVRAAETWHLSYGELKSLSLASLRYSFLPAGEKARLEGRLDAAFRAFEERF